RTLLEKDVRETLKAAFSNTTFMVLWFLYSQNIFVALFKFILNKNNKMKKNILFAGILVISLASCKKEGCMDENASNFNQDAKKDNGSCTYNAPSTYLFTDANGNSTVSYSGQLER